MSPFILDSSFYSETVEDSEPEREMKRRQQRNLSGDLDSEDSACEDNPMVIEISSPTESEAAQFVESTSSRPLPRRSEVDQIASPSRPREEPPVHQPQLPGRTLNEQAPSASVFLDTIGEASTSDDERPLPLSLDRFAYARVALPSKPNRSRSSSSLASTVREDGAKVTKTRPVAPMSTLSSQFTDAQLSMLLVCVCCQVKWTTRKGVSQKLAHIKTCAKKRSFTDATVCSMISQALASAPPKEPSIRPPKQAESRGLQQSKTYLEEVLNDAAVTKKKRKAQSAETVQSVTETRGDILSRARTLLAVVGTDAARDSGGASSSKHVCPNGGPALQESAIHQAAASLEDGKSLVDANAFPATQAFAPSKLATASRTSTLFRLADQSDTNLYDDDDPSRLPTADPAPSNLRSQPTFRPYSSSMSQTNNHKPDLDVSDSCPKPPTHSDILSRLDRAITQANGNAFPRNETRYSTHKTPEDAPKPVSSLPIPDGDLLRYDPGAQTLVSSPRRGMQQDLNKLPSLSQYPSPSPKSRPLLPGERLLRMAQLDQPKGRRRKANEDALDDEKWKEQLKASILTNQTLYLRVLRYEPIHFDEFLRLMVDKALFNSRAALRAFLDEQAINYCGADAGKRR